MQTGEDRICEGVLFAKLVDTISAVNYNKLVFHKALWPDMVGRSLTFNSKRYEVT